MKTLVFTEFLREQEALEKFRENFKVYGRKTLQELLEHSGANWLEQAFIWRYTPEGDDYWWPLHKLWVSTYERVRNGTVLFGTLEKPKRSVKELR